VHPLIDHDRLLATGAERLRRFDQEVQERRVTHQPVHFVHRDDARLLIHQAVAADGGQHLGVSKCLQDRIALQFVEAENTWADPVAPAACEIDVGRAIEE